MISDPPYEIRSEDDQVVIRIPRDKVDEGVISRVLEYMDFEIIRSRSQATQEQIDELAEEVQKAAYERVKHLFENNGGNGE